MTAKEKWNEIVKRYNRFYLSDTEGLYSSNNCEGLTEMWTDLLFEILNYGDENVVIQNEGIEIYKDDIYIPDFIVRNNENILFILELQSNLISYLPQQENYLLRELEITHTAIGIFVCQGIYIYYYDNDKADSDQLAIKIDMVKDNPDGIRFVELFEKYSFNQSLIRHFIESKFNDDVKKIKEELTETLVNQLISKHFSQKYSRQEIKTALLKTNHFNNAPLFSDTVQNAIRNTDPAISKATKIYSRKFTKQDKQITPTEARNLCKRNGFSAMRNGNTTFASINSTERCYWANPKFDKLKQDWYLILNNWKKHELYVLFIPKNYIDKSELKPRSEDANWDKDKKEWIKINLQIDCKDPFLTDLVTKNDPSYEAYSFKRFYIKTIKY